ncbi:hypothetical protein Y032_0939g3129 [Ancylostoma ceylanicum]|uniref:Uncharacterized protein n=2 Tax=Ancylostoma ceylanicum TaxID=53326 RepID=A0A016TP93_9BILA|nr:hypothetical protein Y032_0087g2072 [Ancylostoma ceylanicum]EYC04550.1 hypothetical protein Y032_0087g2075 [Ancylostoma ceylanicum]EYC36053.1 hypothetical protein Y032_0939g3129 [Ancylostoma ceylanicum]
MNTFLFGLTFRPHVVFRGLKVAQDDVIQRATPPNASSPSAFNSFLLEHCEIPVEDGTYHVFHESSGEGLPLQQQQDR